MDTWTIVKVVVSIVVVLIVLTLLFAVATFAMYESGGFKEGLVNMTYDDRVPDCIAAGIVADLEYISDHRIMFADNIVDIYAGFMMVAADGLPLGKDQDRAIENIKYFQSQGYKNYRHVGDFLYLILTGRVIYNPLNMLAFLKQTALMSKELLQSATSNSGKAFDGTIKGSNIIRGTVLTSYPRGVPAMGVSDFKEGVYLDRPTNPPNTPWKISVGDW